MGDAEKYARMNDCEFHTKGVDKILLFEYDGIQYTA